MNECSPENLNAIKLHSIIQHIATRAVRLKLENEIRQRHVRDAPKTFSMSSNSLHANCVSEFLAKHYNSLVKAYAQRRHMPSYVLDIVKTLNPSYPSKQHHVSFFPNDLNNFDANACYQLANALLAIKYPDLQPYEDLILIKNEFYGHLNFLRIKEELYADKIEKLKEIVLKLMDTSSSKDKFLFKQIKDELINRLNAIDSIKASSEFEPSDLCSYAEFHKINRFRFFYSTIPVIEKNHLKI